MSRWPSALASAAFQFGNYIAGRGSENLLDVMVADGEEHQRREGLLGSARPMQRPGEQRGLRRFG
jgi:hypothetical protein